MPMSIPGRKVDIWELSYEIDIGSLRTGLRTAYLSVRKENSIETYFNRSCCNVYSPIAKLEYSYSSMIST